MDDEAIIGQIDYIEEQVDFPIELCNTLKAENTELKEKVATLEGNLQVKADAEVQLTEQRENIRGKIDGLMERLNSYIEVAS